MTFQSDKMLLRDFYINRVIVINEPHSWCAEYYPLMNPSPTFYDGQETLTQRAMRRCWRRIREGDEWHRTLRKRQRSVEDEIRLMRQIHVHRMRSAGMSYDAIGKEIDRSTWCVTSLLSRETRRLARLRYERHMAFVHGDTTPELCERIWQEIEDRTHSHV